MSAIGNYFGANQNYVTNNPATQNTNSSLSDAEQNFQAGEAINDYTTKKQLEAKLTSGINQAAKSFQ